MQQQHVYQTEPMLHLYLRLVANFHRCCALPRRAASLRENTMLYMQRLTGAWLVWHPYFLTLYGSRRERVVLHGAVTMEHSLRTRSRSRHCFELQALLVFKLLLSVQQLSHSLKYL